MIELWDDRCVQVVQYQQSVGPNPEPYRRWVSDPHKEG